jgi:hypothetical protein
VARPARKERQRVRQELLTAELTGEWVVSGRGEAPGGRVFLRDFDVYGPGDDSPFLWFVKVDSEGFLVYVYDDGERALARFDGGILTWDDGDVYQRVCDAKVEQVQEVTGSMDIDDATGVDDDVDDILGGARAVFLGGAYDWHVEDDDFSEAHPGHASMARQLMSGGYIAGNCGTREWTRARGWENCVFAGKHKKAGVSWAVGVGVPTRCDQAREGGHTWRCANDQCRIPGSRRATVG